MDRNDMSMIRNIVIETATGKVLMYGYTEFTRLSVNDYDASTMSIIENTSFVFEPHWEKIPRLEKHTNGIGMGRLLLRKQSN